MSQQNSENTPGGGFGLTSTMYHHATALAVFFGIAVVLMLLKSPTLSLSDFTCEAIFIHSDLAATIVFAIAGSAVAVKAVDGRPFDWKRELIICACAFLTANGGGTFRDVFAGKIPFWMDTWIYALLPIFIGLLASRVSMRCSKKSKIILDIMDNFSAGIFASSGVMQAAQMLPPTEEGFGFLAVFMGMITAIGGGLIRDVLVLHRPPTAVFTTYAIAAFFGSIIQAIVMATGIFGLLGMDFFPVWLIGTLIVFVINELSVGVNPMSHIKSPE